jgi:3-mercaptopyruvate sulfurtransferase SseA
MRAFACLLLLLLAACHGDWGDGMQAFEDARYPQAAASFRRYEPEARRLPPDEFAQYALYRGLTHLALGDARAAARFLGAAKAAVDRDPQILDEADRGRLLAAWRSMGHMPGESGTALR